MNVNYGYVGTLGFSEGVGAVSLGYINCNGQEANLLLCTPNYENANSYCQNHYYDAGVVCES